MEFCVDQCVSFGLMIFFITMCVVHSHEAVAPELQELRKKWGAPEIIRDLEHIKQDIQKITKLQDSGDLSTNEALFYFIRMHDFDDNKKLDGLEMMIAMSHSLENHDDPKPVSVEERETIVDTFFAYDDNNDGFVSYPEFRKHLPDEQEPPLPKL